MPVQQAPDAGVLLDKLCGRWTGRPVVGEEYL
jgi:hypothetical protein